MNKTFRNRIAAAALAFFAMSANAIGGTLAISPTTKDVGVNDSFQLAVLGTGFVEDLIGGGFNLSFDPAILRLDGVSIAAIWEFAPSGGLTDNASGTLSDASFNTFAAPKTGNFDVALLNFTALGSGSSAVILAGSPSFPFADINANTVTPIFTGATVNVTAVPVPPGLVLFVSGLIPLLLRRNRA